MTSHLICHDNIIVLFIMIYDDIATWDVIYYILFLSKLVNDAS